MPYFSTPQAHTSPHLMSCFQLYRWAFSIFCWAWRKLDLFENSADGSSR